MFNEIPPYYAPSGLYVCAPTLISTVTLANPFYRKDSPLEVVECEGGASAQRLIREMQGRPDAVFAQLSDVQNYSESIVSTARHVKEKSYGVVLCPLRGGRMPSVQVATMCQAGEGFRAFDYSDGAKGDNDNRTVTDLLEILGPLSGNSQCEIAVLDAAKGGNGASHLSWLLARRVFPELGASWNCDFHLFYAGDRPEPNTSRVYGNRTKAAQFVVYRHPVTSLLVEDESRLLGYEVSRTGVGSAVHPLSTPGRLVVISEDSAAVYKENPLDQVVIGVVGQEIKNVLDHAEDVRLLEPNYWKHSSIGEE